MQTGAREIQHKNHEVQTRYYTCNDLLCGEGPALPSGIEARNIRNILLIL